MDEESKAFRRLLNKKYIRSLIKRHLSFVFSKDDGESVRLRKEATKMFTAKGHNLKLHYKIWTAFSTSIATAKKDSEFLAAAYGDRSVLLIHLCKYEECIMDIDRALKISKNNDFKIIKLCRKVECLHASGSEGNEKVLEEAESLLKTINDEKKRKALEDLVNKIKLTLDKPAKSINREKDRRIEMLETLHKQHVTNDFSSVDIKYDKMYGRHLIAKKAIKPGEVIYIEEPYTMCFNTKQISTDCSHCYAVTWANIPCDHCPYTMFCSEECKKDAWEKYHDLECPILSMTMIRGKNNGLTQLAVRTLILAIKEAGGSIDKLKTELTTFEKNRDKYPKKGFVKNRKIQSMGFKSIYALAKDVPSKVKKEYKAITTNILTAFAKNTKLFGQNFADKLYRSYKDNEDALFIGALILRLIKISSLNRHETWSGSHVCQNDHDKLSCWENACCSKGVYIAPITALLNHSCDPNARKCFSNDNKVILYAIRPIEEGSQIFDCYQHEFYELDYTPRRKLLKKYYTFDCVCLACQCRWPDKEAMIDLERPFRGSREIQLELEFKDLLSYANSDYDASTIIRLGKGIERGLIDLSRPASTTIDLIICMNKVFESLYGINLSIPAECNNLTKNVFRDSL